MRLRVRSRATVRAPITGRATLTLSCGLGDQRTVELLPVAVRFMRFVPTTRMDRKIQGLERHCGGAGTCMRRRRAIQSGQTESSSCGGGLGSGGRRGGRPDLATRRSSTRHKVTNSHRQSERYQRTDKHHDAPRENPHGSSQSFPGALCAAFILVILSFVMAEAVTDV